MGECAAGACGDVSDRERSGWYQGYLSEPVGYVWRGGDCDGQR